MLSFEFLLYTEQSKLKTQNSLPVPLIPFLANLLLHGANRGIESGEAGF